MAWFKYFKSDQNINSATPNYNYSYPYCKRSISKFTPRDTLATGFWLFANIKDLNINIYKSPTLQTLEDANSYVVVYEKGVTSIPVKTVIDGDYIYFQTAEEHIAGDEIVGAYAIYYSTPNVRKINEVDNAGTDDYQVNLAPVWSDIELEPFIYGDAYSDGASAVGTIYSISTGALPTGLSINSSTGQITGTVNSTGAYSFTIRATTDDQKYYNEATFSGTVYEYPEWVDSTLTNIDYNTTYSNSVWADSYPVATYSISSGALPTGITLNTTTGLVSGITTASGAYAFTVKAENILGSITQSFSGTVQTPPSWSDQTLGIITQGVSYSDGVSATGTASIVYSIYSGALPAGLSLNSSTGAITGTTGATGSYSFTIRATNSWGYVEKAFSGTIYQIPAWTDSTIANMIYGQAYSDSVAASGYPTVTYSISAGALPSGITLNTSTGAISGTSTTAGSYSFTIKAENAAGNVTQLFTDDLYVTPSWTDNTLAAFSYNTAYSDQVVATGSPTYTISSGTLPTGLSLNSSTGAVTGTPTYFGGYSFTIQAANETGSVTQSFSGGINKAPGWTDETLATPTYNTAYSDGVTATGYDGSSDVYYQISSGSLPSGFGINVGTGVISGTYTAPINGSSFTYNFTVRAYNNVGEATKSFTWTISVPFVATGGTVTTSGGYKVHTFTSSGQFVVQSGSKSVEYIVVGGGGGGGGNGAGNIWSGGGGAGGLRTGSSTYAAGYGGAYYYTVVVGGGGAVDANGTESLIDTLSSYVISFGGGLGGGWNYGANSGGSGGGGWANGNATGGSGGSGNSAEGNSGGSGADYFGGGGGGKAAVGSNGSNSSPGNGGSGQTFTWGSSLDGYFAGGGGGAGYSAAGSGGSGVGGYGAIVSIYSLVYGAYSQVAGSATVNRGGGGGGSASAYQAGTGGYILYMNGSAGASGAVIVRYLQ